MKAPKNYLLTAYSMAVYLFLYTPILVLIVFSFNAAEQTATWGGFTLRWYELLWADEQVWAAASNSLRVAAITTVLATVLGTAAALGLRAATPRLLAFANPLLLLPIILPEVVMAVSLLGLFSAVGMELSFSTVWFSHVVFSTS